jgi:glycerol-3-phosphate dehydrogenase (NAD(P)+)
MSTTFAVLGAGAWGTTVAILLAQKPGHRVRLWSARNAADLAARRENTPLLPGIFIPQTVDITADAGQAISGANALIVGVPTVYMRATLAPLAGLVPNDVPVLSLAKGVENETFFRPTEILAALWGCSRLAVLSGPSHAEEVARGLPASLVAASCEPRLAGWVQEQFSGERFRVYTNRDVVGVELAGALKNVMAIAAGIGDGLGFGDNAKAALLTRGLVEMARFGVALGADHETFFGLAGIGDLITTCFSPHGRNRRVGQRLATGESLELIVGGTHMVAEGVYTTRSVYERARQLGIEMPIVTEVYRVLYEQKPPLAAVSDLMLRRPIQERPKPY